MDDGHVGTSADWEGLNEKEQSPSRGTACHHVPNYCHVSSDTAAPKIYVRAYNDRFLIQVNNVVLPAPSGVISALSSWTVRSRWKRRCGGWALLIWSSERISILYVSSVITVTLYVLSYANFAVVEVRVGVGSLFRFVFIRLSTVLAGYCYCTAVHDELLKFC